LRDKILDGPGRGAGPPRPSLGERDRGGGPGETTEGRPVHSLRLGLNNKIKRKGYGPGGIVESGLGVNRELRKAILYPHCSECMCYQYSRVWPMKVEGGGRSVPPPNSCRNASPYPPPSFLGHPTVPPLLCISLPTQWGRLTLTLAPDGPGTLYTNPVWRCVVRCRNRIREYTEK
jgi:hypothetical protein